MAEKITATAPSDKANRPPWNNSIVLQTTKRVKAPKIAGKIFTQNTPLPSCKIIHENIDVIGGTE